jgi:hypothetical protein
MHPWTTAIVGTVALSLAGAFPGIARPKVSSAAPPEAPVFWPHASANLIEYIFFPKGRDDRFWAYGYGAIVDATFSDPAAGRQPFAAKDVDALSSAGPTDSPLAADLCGSGSAAADADTWIERIQQAITPTVPQHEVLKQLRAALTTAIERIKAACPNPPPASPTERLKAIQDRIWAMRDGLLTIRLPFETFYSSLSQEQHWRLNRTESDVSTIGMKLGDTRIGMCSDPAAGSGQGPMRAIERAVRPSEQQRAILEELRLRSAGFAQLIMSSCPTYPLLGHMGRYGAALDRLDVMLFSVMAMAPALQGFYDSLDDRQRMAFHRAMRQLRRAAPARAVREASMFPVSGATRH